MYRRWILLTGFSVVGSVKIDVIAFTLNLVLSSTIVYVKLYMPTGYLMHSVYKIIPLLKQYEKQTYNFGIGNS